MSKQHDFHQLIKLHESQVTIVRTIRESVYFEKLSPDRQKVVREIEVRLHESSEIISRITDKKEVSENDCNEKDVPCVSYQLLKGLRILLIDVVGRLIARYISDVLNGE